MFEKLQIHVRPTSQGKIKARVTMSFDDAFAINGISLVEGKDGLFVSYPSWKDANGEYHNYAYPLNAEARRRLSNMIVDMYEGMIE